MVYIVRTLLRIAIITLPTACTTMNFSAYKFEKVGTNGISVVPKAGAPWEYSIRNDTSDDLMLSLAKSAFILNSESYRVVTGDSKITKMDQASVDVPIAAGKRKSVVFLPPELLNIYYKDGWQMAWKQYPRDGDKYEFRFVFIKDDGKVVRSTLSGTVHTVKVSVSDTNKYVCWGTAIIYGGWCWFVPTPDDIRNGTDAAKKKYGEDTIVEYRNSGI